MSAYTMIWLLVAAFFFYLAWWLHTRPKVIPRKVIGYHFCGNCGHIVEFCQWDNSDHYNCPKCGFKNIVLKIWSTREELVKSEAYLLSAIGALASYGKEEEELEEDEYLVFIDNDEEECE